MWLNDCMMTSVASVISADEELGAVNTSRPLHNITANTLPLLHVCLNVFVTNLRVLLKCDPRFSVERLGWLIGFITKMYTVVHSDSIYYWRFITYYTKKIAWNKIKKFYFAVRPLKTMFFSYSVE